MLVLESRGGERVLIRLRDGQIITVMVTKIRDMDRVKLGFDAPSGIDIVREGVPFKPLAPVTPPP